MPSYQECPDVLNPFHLLFQETKHKMSYNPNFGTLDVAYDRDSLTHSQGRLLGR